MDPDRYYKYSDIKTMPSIRPEVVPEAVLEEGEVGVVYMLEELSQKRPGAVLAVGFGMPLRNVVRAAANAQVRPLFSTATDDKQRGFTFAGTATPISIGKKFNEKLFTNEYAILQAADNCQARTILWGAKTPPTDLLAREAARQGILLLKPFDADKTLSSWEFCGTNTSSNENREVIWWKCPHCGFTHDSEQILASDWNCPNCGKLYRMDSEDRITSVFDKGTFTELFEDVPETNPMDFPEFDQVIERARKRSNHSEGVCCGIGRINGIPAAAAVMETKFMMGSMGAVVGEKITRLIEQATANNLPVIIFCASGGARMQEGLASLMQMAKISSALEAHARAKQLYISVLTDPTTGGVTASFATLGDVILAEPEALIGFAGRRVIQDTIKQTLPDSFQSAEFALEHGLIDAIVKRSEMRDALTNILELHGYLPLNPTCHVGEANAKAASEQASDAKDATLDSSNKQATSDAEVGPNASTDSTSTDSTDSDSKTDLDALGSAQEDEADSQSHEKGSASAKTNDVVNSLLQNIPSQLRGFVDNVADAADHLGHAIGEQTSNFNMIRAIRSHGVADIPYVKPSKAKTDPDTNLAWESVQLARNVKRPTSLYYIATMVDDFFELHGDRMFADDGAIVAGLGRINGNPVTVIAQEKGSNLKERIARNFGCPQPEGYRKAQRLMHQADKFGRPIVCLVDTQGAFCGKEAEERGMGNAIAESLSLMAGLTVPVISVVIGEGGSGGALALAVANRVAMQENAVYSVLSPEGFASILWKDGSRAAEAADVMKMRAQDALGMGIIDDVISEGSAPAHENPDQAAATLWLYIANALDELSEESPEALREQRYKRFRKY